ncbi:MAG: hypothetical protein MUF83_16990 [Acidimicrobiales bacterium]|nr:hypothetical protein [Acidimicrobiales bacterium]
MTDKRIPITGRDLDVTAAARRAREAAKQSEEHKAAQEAAAQTTVAGDLAFGAEIGAEDRIGADALAARAETVASLTDLTREPGQGAARDDGRPDLSGVDPGKLSGLRPPSSDTDWTPIDDTYGDSQNVGGAGKSTSLISDGDAPTNVLSSAQGAVLTSEGVKGGSAQLAKDYKELQPLAEVYVTGGKGSTRAEMLQAALDEQDGKVGTAATPTVPAAQEPAAEPVKGKTTVGSDGTVVTDNGEGTIRVKKPDGTVVVQNPDGSIDQTNPDGSTEHYDAPGSGWFGQPDPENETALPAHIQRMIDTDIARLKDRATPQTGEEDGDIDFGDDPDGVHAPIDRKAPLPDMQDRLLGGGQLGDAPDLDFGGSPDTGPDYNGNAGAIDWGPDAASGGPQSGREDDPFGDQQPAASVDLRAGTSDDTDRDTGDDSSAAGSALGVDPTLYGDHLPHVEHHGDLLLPDTDLDEP